VPIPSPSTYVVRLRRRSRFRHCGEWKPRNNKDDQQISRQTPDWPIDNRWCSEEFVRLLQSASEPDGETVRLWQYQEPHVAKEGMADQPRGFLRSTCLDARHPSC
ncbi:hypothetical protein JMJ77_0014101, partial [Colletotrichum scovillei]